MTRRNSEQGGFRLDKILLILLIPGLVAALIVGMSRYKLESRSRNIELTLDYNELQNLSVSSGVSMPGLLEQFKDAGASGVAISEDLLGDFVTNGQAQYTVRASDVGPLTVIYIRDMALRERVLKALTARLPSHYLMYDAAQAPLVKSAGFVVRAAPSTLNLIGLGPSPAAVKLVQNTGMDVVARLQNHPALTKKAVDAAIADMKADGITRMISASDEVYGYRGLIEYTAKKIQEAGIVFGSIEFSKQRGDARMAKELDSRFIRVHSVPVAEMGQMAPSSIMERFVRAVKERDIRLCYVRLPETSGENPLRSSTDFVSSISGQMKQAGYTMGVAEPFGAMSRPRPLLVLMALAVVAGAVLLLSSLFSLSPAIKYGVLVVGFVMAAGLSMFEPGRQLLALKAALIFPTLGVMALAGQYFNRDANEKSPVLKASLLFLGVSAVSLCGALLVVGLLSDRSYMVKVNQFTGIKAAHLFPLLYVMFFMVAGLPILGKPFSQVKDEVIANIRGVVSHPLFVWHAIAVMAALVVIGLAVMRTGNDAAVGVSGVELKFRAILDKLLIVRPRTKEFLIGHPALFIGLAMLLTRRRAWGLPLVAFGVLGQVSLLNTFCHIHSPLGISILRAFNGIALGLLIGIGAYLVLARPKRTYPTKT